jgi:hypothetical protein
MSAEYLVTQLLEGSGTDEKAACPCPHDLVTELLEGSAPAQVLLSEAPVRLPARGTRWIAAFQGPRPGQQIQKSTGLTNRSAALKLARQWEAEAKAERQARKWPRKPTIRGRGNEGWLTQQEVAALMGLSVRAVYEIERRALEKLRTNPRLREFWSEYVGGAAIEEEHDSISTQEIAALIQLCRSRLEQSALQTAVKLILMSGV